MTMQPTQPRSPSETRRLRQREEARRAILDATEALMLECGGEGFSIRQLADRCGYTAPTIYHYFGDKQALVDALLEERFERLLEMVKQVALGPDPLANVRAMIDVFLRFTEQNQAFYRLIMAGRRAGDDRTPASAHAAQERMLRPWLELHAAGRLHCDDPLEAGQAMWALMHGLSALQLARPDYEWAPNLREIAIDSMLRGLLRPGRGGSDA